MPGQAQSLALSALASLPQVAEDGVVRAAASASGGPGQGTRQRRGLLRTLAEVGIAGAEGSLVAAAARALPASPGDVAALVVEVLQGDIQAVGGKVRRSRCGDACCGRGRRV